MAALACRYHAHLWQVSSRSARWPPRLFEERAGHAASGCACAQIMRLKCVVSSPSATKSKIDRKLQSPLQFHLQPRLFQGIDRFRRADQEIAIASARPVGQAREAAFLSFGGRGIGVIRVGRYMLRKFHN